MPESAICAKLHPDGRLRLPATVLLMLALALPFAFGQETALCGIRHADGSVTDISRRVPGPNDVVIAHIESAKPGPLVLCAGDCADGKCAPGGPRCAKLDESASCYSEGLAACRERESLKAWRAELSAAGKSLVRVDAEIAALDAQISAAVGGCE